MTPSRSRAGGRASPTGNATSSSASRSSRRCRGPAQKQYTPQTRAALLELAYVSNSDALLTLVTDALGWSERMNTPGTVGTHNWTLRLPWTSEQLFSASEPVATAHDLARLARRSGRLR